MVQTHKYLGAEPATRSSVRPRRSSADRSSEALPLPGRDGHRLPHLSNVNYQRTSAAARRPSTGCGRSPTRCTPARSPDAAGPAVAGIRQEAGQVPNGRAGGKFLAIQASRDLVVDPVVGPARPEGVLRRTEHDVLRDVQVDRAEQPEEVGHAVERQVRPDGVLGDPEQGRQVGQRRALRTLSTAAMTSICWRLARWKSLSPLRLRAKISASAALRWLLPAGRPQPWWWLLTQ